MVERETFETLCQSKVLLYQTPLPSNIHPSTLHHLFKHSAINVENHCIISVRFLFMCTLTSLELPINSGFWIFKTLNSSSSSSFSSNPKIVTRGFFGGLQVLHLILYSQLPLSLLNPLNILLTLAPNRVIPRKKKSRRRKKKVSQQTSRSNPKHAIWSRFGKLNEVIYKKYKSRACFGIFALWLGKCK